MIKFRSRSGSNVELSVGLSSDDAQELYSQKCIQWTGDDRHPAQFLKSEFVHYLSCRVDGSFCGALLLIDRSLYELDLHCLILGNAVKEYREILTSVLDFIFDNTNCLRVTGWIRDDFTSQINAAKKCGFIHEGVRRECCTVNGTLRDVVMLGITKSDWSKL